MPVIPFGEWRPDMPDYENPGATTVTNVYPRTPKSYGPWRALQATTGAISGTAQAAISGITPSGDYETFAADEFDIYELGNTGTWTAVSDAAGYSTATEERWEMVTYGGMVVASNFSDPVQRWSLGTSAAFDELSSSVTASTDWAPRARHMGVVREFLVLGNVNDPSDGTRLNRIAWSQQGAPENSWTNTALGADFQELYNGTRVQKIVGGEFGVIFCETSVYRMTFVGGDTIFQFDEIEPNRGCFSPGSVATNGRLTFFLDQDGFYVFDGQSSTPIGAQKIDQWFLSRFNNNSTALLNMSATLDTDRKLYLLAYAETGSTTPNRLLIYNWEIKRWSVCEIDLQLLTDLRSAGFTLEQLDNINSSIDALPASLDSRQWAGGAPLIGAFTTDSELGAFGGDALAATIETSEAQLFGPKRSLVRWVRPVVDTVPRSVQIGSRDLLSDAVSWGVDTAVDATGKANILNSARYHRVRVNIDSGADWEHAQGVEADATAAGRI